MNALASIGLALVVSIVSLGCGGSTDSLPSAGSDPQPAPAHPSPPAAPTPGAAPVETVPQAPPPDPIVELPAGAEERRILQLVAPKHLEEMDRLVGRYVRGDAPVYQGTFSARDNMGSLGPTYQDGVMTNASVNASLGWEEKLYWNGQMVSGWALFVRGPAHWIRLAQSPTAPGSSALTIVVPNAVGGGMTGTCTGCLPTLAPTAGTITIGGTVARGKWGNGKLLEVTASGTLTRVPLPELSFEQLVAIAEPNTEGAAMKEFKAVGAEMVRVVERTHSEPTPVPADQTFYACERITSYELDWFVDRARLVRYGLRNMSIAGTQTCCSEGPPGMCAPRVCW
jgi:hypothetical protein